MGDMLEIRNIALQHDELVGWRYGLSSRVPPWRAVRTGLDCSGILTVVVCPLRTSRVSAREIGRAWGHFEIAVLTPCSPGPLGTAAEPLQCSTWQIVDRLGYSSQFPRQATLARLHGFGEDPGVRADYS